MVPVPGSDIAIAGTNSRIETSKNHTFANLRNCSNKKRGKKFKVLYLDVTTRLETNSVILPLSVGIALGVVLSGSATKHLFLVGLLAVGSGVIFAGI